QSLCDSVEIVVRWLFPRVHPNPNQLFTLVNKEVFLNRFRLIFLAAAVAFWMTAHPAPLQAQNTVKIVSGNGQLVSCGAPLVVSIIAICPSYQTLVVQVVNAFGVPQAGVPVNWAVTSGGFTAGGNAFLLNGAATTTDGNGMTQNLFGYGGNIGPQGGPFQQYAPSTITVATTDSTAVFTVTSAVFDACSPANAAVTPVAF